MSKRPEAVWKMIKELASKAKPVAQKELKTLQVRSIKNEVFHIWLSYIISAIMEENIRIT